MGGVNLFQRATLDQRRVIGDDSDQMVDRFQLDVVDRHPEMVVILAASTTSTMVH